MCACVWREGGGAALPATLNIVALQRFIIKQLVIQISHKYEQETPSTAMLMSGTPAGLFFAAATLRSFNLGSVDSAEAYFHCDHPLPRCPVDQHVSGRRFWRAEGKSRRLKLSLRSVFFCWSSSDFPAKSCSDPAGGLTGTQAASEDSDTNRRAKELLRFN